LGRLAACSITEAAPGQSCKLSVAGQFDAARRRCCKCAVEKKINVCNRTDNQAYFGDATLRGALRRFAGTEKEKTQ
jgi:hypothetical protein